MKRLAAEKTRLRFRWLRSPNTNNANNVYNVTASGASNNNNANNTNGVSLDRMMESFSGESKRRVIAPAETPKKCKEPQTLPRVHRGANRDRRRRRRESDVPAASSDIFSFASLFRAVRECARGVSWKNSVMKWKLDTAKLCKKLYDELHNGKYRLSPYVTFEVVSPKRRTIRSLLFRDRVVQRVMCFSGVYRDLTRANIYDNGACQQNRGTLFALDRLRVLLGRYYRKNGRNGWVLRLDIRKFFDSIPHDRLCAMVRRKVSDPVFAEMICDIVGTFGENGRGIGLGSQISQLLAISYLSGLDHRIKEKMKIKCYVRYSDDMVLVHPDPEHLMRCFREIRGMLAELGLELNQKSTIHPLRQGIIFLKFRYIVTETGKVVCKPTRPMIVRARRRLMRMVHKGVSREEIWTSFNSWAAFAMQGSAYGQVIKLKKQLERAMA